MPSGGARQNPGNSRAKPRIPCGEHEFGPPGPFENSIDFAMKVINDKNVLLVDKIRLAIALMPFQHPKIEVETGKKADVEAAAKRAVVEGKFSMPASPRRVA